MSSTLSSSNGDLQAVKACIAAAVTEVPIKLQQAGAGKNTVQSGQLLLSPVDLTQANAIAQYLGELVRPYKTACHLDAQLPRLSRFTTHSCDAATHRRIHFAPR